MSVHLVANENIRSPKVIVIDADGTNLGEFAKFTAISKARAEGFDLVQVAETKGLPVCKLGDYGKMKYDLAKKEKHVPKPPTLKEMTFHLNTADHDADIKKKKVREFLLGNHKVKLTIILSGRERAFRQGAKDLLAQHISSLSDVAKAEDIRVSDRFISSVLSPIHHS